MSLRTASDPDADIYVFLKFRNYWTKTFLSLFARNSIRDFDLLIGLIWIKKFALDPGCGSALI